LVTSRVVHFQIGAGDADRLADFYSEVFGWTVRSIPLTSPPGGPYHRITPTTLG
jgi:predicted enzyme related to lactoylglutathione lyase